MSLYQMSTQTEAGETVRSTRMRNKTFDGTHRGRAHGQPECAMYCILIRYLAARTNRSFERLIR